MNATKTKKKIPKCMWKAYHKVKEYAAMDDKDMSFKQKTEFITLAIICIAFNIIRKTNWVNVACFVSGVAIPIILYFVLR